MLSNSCSAGTIIIISDPQNWWILAASYISAMLTLFVMSILEQKSRNWLIDTALYGTISGIFVLGGSLMGFNPFILSYIFNSPLPGYMAMSFGVFGIFFTLLLDHFSYSSRLSRQLKESGKSTSWAWNK
jgi:hypothetical protein